MTEAANIGGVPPSTYAVLRRGGVSPWKAKAEMALEPQAAERLEALFRARISKGGEETQPRFARHEAHVAAVKAQGGFASLTERSCRGGGTSVGLPLTWPDQEEPRGR
jgi:hypothetical protein